MKATRMLLAGTLTGCVFLGGCGDGPTAPTAPGTPASPRDTLRLTSITPAAATALPRGQVTRVEALLSYEFASAGRGRLLVYSDPVGFDIGTYFSGQLDSRSGSATASFDLSIGQGAAVPTIVPLNFGIIPEGGSEVTRTVRVQYVVAP
jgi:hypothetical protein